jgi:phosphodiesterase/alkaline phosphatase D-like protein
MSTKPLKMIMTPLILLASVAILFAFIGNSGTAAESDQTNRSTYESVITHGPILGRLSHDSVGVWVRTSSPARFRVTCRIGHVCVAQSPMGETHLENDNTGWVIVPGLKPNTTYEYEVELDSNYWMKGGSFTTLPHADAVRNPQNPEGLFNFSFEFGCGNQQNILEDPGPGMIGYKTMYDNFKGKIHFQIMNGDWLYEEQRDLPVEKWQKMNAVPNDNIPRTVEVAPTIVGVWANYKVYLSRAKNLAKWHRNIPAFFIYDDHEMINDINATNNPGHRHRKTVFRDIGIQAWRDYLGWSNPLSRPNPQGILFGKADFSKGVDVLVDKEADFSKLDLDQASNLMVHWGTPTAGVNDDSLNEVGGHPAAGVYEIVKILDRNRLQIHPAPKADGKQASYSIGMRNYYQMRVSNCHFFILDCRGHRQLHDKKNPWKKGLSMLSLKQKEWLKEGMRQSDADFFFVVSSVNLTIPHVGPGPPGKDEAWTVYMEEREELIEFWDNLGKPVMVLTGDLHNSFVIKITDRVWEFASGPHNSGNHSLMDEANRPPNGDYEYNGRKVNIRWSTFLLDDVDYYPNEFKLPIRPFPFFCVVQVNNVLNNPLKLGEDRWVAYPQPQVIFKYYSGITGELMYAEAIAATKRAQANK